MFGEPLGSLELPGLLNALERLSLGVHVVKNARLSVLTMLLCAFVTTDGQASPPTPEEAKTREITVSATRIETPVEKVGSSVTVITSEEIERSGKHSVAEILRTVPSVDVVRSGGLGGNTAVFIRGANSEHTLILIDGVEANDPINPTRSFNFSDLSLDNIERIEVLRGAQSTLYGSDAIGGVIAIYTKRGQGAPSGTVSIEGGSYESFREQANFQASVEQSDVSLSASREDSRSISAADASDGNSEHDRYGKTAASLRVDTKASEELTLSLTGRFTDSDSDLDNNGGVGGDDPNRKLSNQQLFTRATATLDLFDSALVQTYGVGFTRQDVDDNNDPDPASIEELRSNYTGELLKFDLQNSIDTGTPLGFIVGIETEQERGSSRYKSDGLFGPFEQNFSEETTRSNGYFAQSLLDIPGRFFASAGVRLDDHSDFGTQSTWRVAPALLIPETGTKFLGSIGTGFKAPSLFQLYSSFGNPDLNPEESTGWDIGVAQDLWDGSASMQVTFFKNDFDDLISFDPETFRSININEAKSQGVEISSLVDIDDQTSIRLVYTYTDTEDEETGQTLLRRARNKISTSLLYQPVARFDCSATLSYIGPRADTDFSTFPSERVTLGGYTVASATARYQLSEDLELGLRAENLFDREYQEVLGYGTNGAAIFASVKLAI